MSEPDSVVLLMDQFPDGHPAADELIGLRSACSKLKAEIESLRAALQPFADALTEAEKDYPDDVKLHCQWAVQLPDFKHAREALSAKSVESEGEKG